MGRPAPPARSRGARLPDLIHAARARLSTQAAAACLNATKGPAVTLLYKANAARGLAWQRCLAAEAPDLPFRLWPEVGDPRDIRYLAAWEPPEALADFPNLEIVFSVAAGVDRFDLSRFPAHIPLIRMMEPGIGEAMVDYVTLAVLSIHRNLVAYIDQQRRRVWQEREIRPAAESRVGILGLGHLGQATASRLHRLGFPVSGWSRSRRSVPDVTSFAGRAELPAFLAQTDILVCLLPLTEETRGILDRELFSGMPRGAALVNVGRGQHLVDRDLLSALDEGQLSAAVLDVADPEPPPTDHPFWAHPKILMTPHSASMTRPESAVRFVLDTIARRREGRELIGEVDRERGY